MKIYIAVILSLFSLLSAVHASERECVDLSRINNYNSEYGLAWTAPADVVLESWRLEFELSGSYISRGDIFWTYHHPTPAKLKQGITLSVTDTLQLQVKQGDNVVTSEMPWLISGTSCTLAFQFILVENEEGIAQKGEFTIVSGNQTLSYVIEDVDALPYASFRESNANSMLSRFQTYNGAYTYSDISLYQLENRVIPEPGTTMLVLCSAFCLLFHRRRK